MLGRRALPSLNHVLRNISRPASSTSKSDNATSSAVTKKAEVPLPTTTQQQSPNYPSTWSTSQRPRPGLGSSPQFEQTDMNLQPNPLSAMELIANEPIQHVHGRKAVCDGGMHICLLLGGDTHTLSLSFSFLSHSTNTIYLIGGGPLGHPKIYINLVSYAAKKKQTYVFFFSFCSYYIDRTGSAWTSCLRVCDIYCYLRLFFIDSTL
jgi:NADH dehydrogenase (ubiquinone) Fe-S protein 6